MKNMSLVEIVREYKDQHIGQISEEEIIEVIAYLAGGEEMHDKGTCTETNPGADSLCGARSLVEYAMSAIHPGKG